MAVSGTTTVFAPCFDQEDSMQVRLCVTKAVDALVPAWRGAQGPLYELEAMTQLPDPHAAQACKNWAQFWSRESGAERQGEQAPEDCNHVGICQ